MNRYNSDIQLKPLTVQKSEVLCIGIVKKVTLLVLFGIRVLSVLGVSRRQEYGTKWNVVHN